MDDSLGFLPAKARKQIVEDYYFEFACLLFPNTRLTQKTSLSIVATDNHNFNNIIISNSINNHQP